MKFSAFAQRSHLGLYKRGQAMITMTIILLFVGLLTFFGISLVAVDETRIARRVLASEQSYFAAEAGVEDMAYRFKTGKQTPSSTVIFIGAVGATTTVTTVAGGKEIVSRGDALSAIRKAKSVLATTDGVSFVYGVQVGDGGIFMENTSKIIGSVYSNGNIIAQNEPEITGDAFAAVTSTISGMTINGNTRANRFEENTIGGSATSSTVIYTGSVGGNAWADIFSGGTVNGNAYYRTSISATTTVNGLRIQIAEAIPTLPKLNMPISDTELDQMEQEALAGGTVSSPCPYKPADGSTIGPKKINCDVEIDGTKIVTLAGTLWVSGNFKIKNSAQLKLAPSFGALSGVVVTDNPSNRLTSGKVEIDNTAQILGSGQAGSYIMVVSRNNSAESGGNETAIDVKNSSATAIYYAPHGEILFQNNGQMKEATAWKLHTKNSVQVIYESGLADVKFSSGPTGGWKIQSWTEIE